MALNDQDWDRVAADIGLPADWREAGYDSPEYMAQAESIYRAATTDDGRTPGMFKCYPCDAEHRRTVYRTRNLEALFRHVHGEHS